MATEKKVTIRTPRAPQKGPKSFQIIINGKVWNIPYGKEVTVPDYVATEFYRSEAAKDNYEAVMEEEKAKLQAAAEASEQAAAAANEVEG